MQDSYVGNIRDFAKYGLLRALTDTTTGGEHLSLGVVWYYNGPGEQRPDRVWAYLHEPDEYRGCDQDLFDALQVFTDPNERSIRKVIGLDIIEGAVPFCNDVSREPRTEWLSGALERTEDTRVVFLDPDVGLAPPSQRDKNSRRHAYPNEVRRFAERDQTVVVYQSYERNATHGKQQQRWRDDLQPVLRPGQHVAIVKFGSGLNPPVQCAFIVLAAHRHSARIDKRIKKMLEGDWGGYFERQ